MANPIPNAQLAAALAQFASQPGVSADQSAQLRSAVVADPIQLSENCSWHLFACLRLNPPYLPAYCALPAGGSFHSKPTYCLPLQATCTEQLPPEPALHAASASSCADCAAALVAV